MAWHLNRFRPCHFAHTCSQWVSPLRSFSVNRIEPSPCIAWSADCDCDYDCDYQPPQLLLLVLVNSTGRADCLPENVFFPHNRMRRQDTRTAFCSFIEGVRCQRLVTPPTWHSPPTAGGVGAAPGCRTRRQDNRTASSQRPAASSSSQQPAANSQQQQPAANSSSSSGGGGGGGGGDGRLVGR